MDIVVCGCGSYGSSASNTVLTYVMEGLTDPGSKAFPKFFFTKSLGFTVASPPLL